MADDRYRALPTGYREALLTQLDLLVTELQEERDSPSSRSRRPCGHAWRAASWFKHKGWYYADLSWSGNSTATHVDIYRNGVKVAAGTSNDGAHYDRMGKDANGSYVYRVCEAGSTTACSNETTVSIS